MTCNQWYFARNERWTLENRDYIIILTHINIEDIDYNPTIKQDLSAMGLVKFEPLTEDDREYCSVKATCRSKEDCKNILNTYYLSGKKYKTINNEILSVRFGPNLPNPKICFNCYKYDHVANECPQQTLTCEKCAEQGHKKAQCTSEVTRCVNCNGAHEAPSIPTTIQGSMKG